MTALLTGSRRKEAVARKRPEDALMHKHERPERCVRVTSRCSVSATQTACLAATLRIALGRCCEQSTDCAWMLESQHTPATLLAKQQMKCAGVAFVRFERSAQ
eukprot:5166610-Pleurochrysis_carterae.AAC.2